MFNKVKQHISNNRGKYGTAVGAGALYGASQIDTPLMNQAKFNAMAQGQNLAHNSANYIDEKLDTNLVNNLNSVGVRGIDPEQINLINQGYDKFKGTPYTGADAKDAINMAEFNSIPYAQRIASGDDVDDARMDYLNSGANFIKKSAGQAYDHMTESTGVICIPIKHALLEGYQPEEIVEAFHNYSQKQRETFVRRGINATNTVNGKQFATGLAPVGGVIGGGAIGNQIHGDDGTINGVTFNEQLNNDDEFDGTGALVGGAIGGLANFLVNSPNSSKTMNRLKNITNTTASPEERHFVKEQAPLVKTGNTILKGLEIGQQIRNKIQR